MERTGYYDAGNGWKDIYVVVVCKKIWSLWCGSYGEGSYF